MPDQAQPYDHDHENEITLFASTNYRNQQRKFGIKTDDRRRHMYMLGKTGMGKTTILENLVLSDIYAGHGVCYIDPHGDAAQKLLDFIPSNRINDVVYFNPGDVENPIGFNIFEVKDESQKHLIASGLMGVFKKIWPDVWSARMEYILMNTILALLDAPGSSLLGITRILVDEEYRKRVVSLIQDPVVKSFWVKEFASWQEKYRTEAVAPVQNKVGQFLSARIIRNIVAQVKSTIDMRDIMDSRKIFIVNLSKGLIGEENMRLLGGMLITKLQMTVMERVDTPEEDRLDFYLYVDEFQNFANESFASILSEARKYRLNLVVAHQYIEQMDEETRAAVFGNVGTLLMFRVGAADAEVLEQEFTPTFTAEDLVNLRKFDVYLKLMINGAASEPFSATTLPPIGNPTGSVEKVIRVSRERYSRPRNTIEGKIVRWSGLAVDEEKEGDANNDIVSAASELGISEEDLKNLEKSSPAVKEAAPSASKKRKEAKYEIPCSICGEIQKLTFEPDWTKPWYCREHLEMRGKIPMRELKFYNPKKQAELAKKHQEGGPTVIAAKDFVEPAPAGRPKPVVAPPASRPPAKPAPAAKPIESKPVEAKPAPTAKTVDSKPAASKPVPTGRPSSTDRPATAGKPSSAGRPKKNRPSGDLRRPQQKRQDSKPVKNIAPPPIRDTEPVVKDEANAGLSLSALTPRDEKKSGSPIKVQESKSPDINRPKPENQPEPPPAKDEKPVDDAPNKDSGDDQGPKQIKPGEVVKF